MSAARKQAFNRNAAIASIQLNWPKISPGGDRDERLGWISEYLGRDVGSLKDLSNDQLGAVAGEMKRLVGGGQRQEAVKTGNGSDRIPAAANVVDLPADRNPVVTTPGSDFGGEISHAASPEQVFTLEKIVDYLNWSQADVFEFIRKRVIRGKERFSVSVPNIRMLRFKQATTATHILLRIAAQRDLKKRNPGQPVGREAIAKYVPLLKEQLGIDQGAR